MAMKQSPVATPTAPLDLLPCRPTEKHILPASFALAPWRPAAKRGGPMLDPFRSPLLGPLFASAAMRARLSDLERLQRMLDVEAALARAEAAAGVTPQRAVAVIAAACQAERYDLAALGAAAVDAGNIAIPLVKALTAEVGKTDKEAARYVHWGATSQDIIDT